MTSVNVPAPFTLDELLSQLRSGETKDLSEYRTAEEWGAALGVPKSRMSDLLNKASKAGLLRHDKAKRRAIDGSWRWSNVYAFDLQEVKEQCHGA
jgi:hypothetical protein